MIRDEYSPYKIIHHENKLKELRGGLDSVPLLVQLIPTNKCNRICRNCAYRIKGHVSNQTFCDTDYLNYEKIKECVYDFKRMGVRAVEITGGGEPLVHPKILNVFKEIMNLKLDLALVSNGIKLNDEICELLGETSWVRISVDAVNADTYKLIGGGPIERFDKVIKNIKTLVQYRKSVIIGIGFVVQKENWEQIYEAAKFFKEIGVNNFRISAAFTPEKYKYFNGFMERATALAYEASTLTDENFTVFNLFNDRIQDTFVGRQHYDYCPSKDLITYVGADANVYTCCTLAYNKLGLIGSIKNQSFFDLWNSADKRNMFKNHNPLKHCRVPCLYRNKNYFINYCIKQNPRHINFI